MALADRVPANHADAIEDEVEEGPMSTDPGELRELAVKRLRERRDFGSHLITFLVINAAIVAVWAATAQGYFWPAWIIGGWGIGLVLHAWEVFWRKPVTEADVEREVERLGRRPGGSPVA